MLIKFELARVPQLPRPLIQGRRILQHRLSRPLKDLSISPSDFPFPEDAEKVLLNESSVEKKSVMFIYKTYADIKELDEMYAHI